MYIRKGPHRPDLPKKVPSSASVQSMQILEKRENGRWRRYMSGKTGRRLTYNPWIWKKILGSNKLEGGRGSNYQKDPDLIGCASNFRARTTLYNPASNHALLARWISYKDSSHSPPAADHNNNPAGLPQKDTHHKQQQLHRPLCSMVLGP